jgi:predicted ArsR family transcriptional regulator
MSGSSSARTSVLDVMIARIRRDLERGGTGLISTPAVADRAGLTTAEAREVLDELENAGLVEGFDAIDEGVTRPSYEWRLAGYEWDPSTEKLVETTRTDRALGR